MLWRKQKDSNLRDEKISSKSLASSRFKPLSHISKKKRTHLIWTEQNQKSDQLPKLPDGLTKSKSQQGVSHQSFGHSRVTCTPLNQSSKHNSNSPSNAPQGDQSRSSTNQFRCLYHWFFLQKESFLHIFCSERLDSNQWPSHPYCDTLPLRYTLNYD